MKLIIKLLFIMSLLITLNSCRTYKIYLKDGVNEAKVKKVAVPRKLRASGFHEEEDLTSLCPDSEIVYIRFFFKCTYRSLVRCEGSKYKLVFLL